ncbi:ATP synthase F1 subunit gamma [Candidatus Gottesmanbacteria bacterium]|nr:ATP synthase F1 subunit gamma [Candidatus Gottesmanbacteria bacterium]
MASIRLIRGRIKSAKNISQITKAMEMVAASKMKKAQENALQGKPYADKIYEATRELAGRTSRKAHPLLSSGNSIGKRLVIIVSTNKGLCGGLNTNLFRMLVDWFPQSVPTEYITLGKKGTNFVVKTGRFLCADFSEKYPFEINVPAVISLVVSGFTAGTYREVYIAYNSFENALKQIPVKKVLLPITMEETLPTPSKSSQPEFVMEPDIDEILEYLLPHYLENQLRTATHEGEASEHSARMIAMKNATDAAVDLMEDLTLMFNKARQEKITYEIADIVTARLAVEE